MLSNGKLSYSELSIDLCKPMKRMYISLALNHERYYRKYFIFPKDLKIILFMIKIITDSIFRTLG